jgi:RNA polymerase sigma-70 factor (ECF subfamily)
LQEQELDDRALAAAVLRKDRKATAEFVARFADSLHGYLCRRLMPREDVVEDLFQQTFLESWQHLPGWRGDAPLKPWLLGIARHKVQDYYRARLRESEMPEEDEHLIAESDGVLEWLEMRDQEDRVERVLASLPEVSRLLLVWRYWEHYSAEQMASQTGRTVKAIERALARARDQFREHWMKGERRG